MTQILVVEDEPIIRQALQRLLERHGYQVVGAESISDAEAHYGLGGFDLIISDLRLPGRPGTDLIQLAPETPVLIMTSYASLRSAVDAMKQGAVDYIAKPFDHDEMLTAVQEILDRQPKASVAATSAPVQEPSGETGAEHPSRSRMLGSSHTMQSLQQRIAKVARTDATVLIQGESGTGKELAARAIHEQSPRSQAPMVSVNCAAIPETLIESELFGHEKGAFTGAVSSHRGLIEAADGGTLFLDEIGELPLEAQARLLRVLQEGEIRKVGSVTPRQVDVRLVAATHRNLKALTRTGQFREDLFYRLYIMEIRMPPLRERGEDILNLAAHFLEKACKKLGTGPLTLSQPARRLMLQYPWPGNVRELENAIERAAILCESREIQVDQLGLEPQPPGGAPASAVEHGATGEGPEHGAGPSLSLEDYFQRFVLENQDRMTETELARRLGVSRKCLWERRQRLGIPRPGRNTQSTPE